MMNKNEVIQYKNKIENLQDLLIWDAIKEKIIKIFTGKTDKGIDEDIKRTIQTRENILTYSIGKRDVNYIDLINVIGDYYYNHKEKYNKINIVRTIQGFKFSHKWHEKIQNLESWKNFITKFNNNGYKVSVYMSEKEEVMILKVYL